MSSVQDVKDADPLALRRLVLAVSVLDDIDAVPCDGDVLLPGTPPVLLGREEVAQAVGDRAPESAAARERLSAWLRARRAAADLGPVLLAARLRPLGLPVGHLLHPGPGWVREAVLGGALELGLGAVGLDPDQPDDVVPLPPGALPDGLAAAAWPPVRRRLEELGALAADLLSRAGDGRLRPVGGADVPTLLGARSLRDALVAAQAGLAGAVVPMRTRGWTQLSLIDPAFGPAAAAATEPAQRGFARPLLLTAEEVTVVPDGGSPALLVLRQAGRPDSPWGREVLRR